MTIERYVHFETSKLLKHIGFEWPGLKATGQLLTGNAQPPFFNTCFNDEGKIITPKYYNVNNSHYPRPTLAMALDWVEENFGVFVHIDVSYEDNYVVFSGVARDLKTKETLWKTYVTNKDILNKHAVIEQILYNFLKTIQ